MMKRTKESEPKPRTNSIKWINQGGPFYTKDKRVIKSGETFEASPADVPMAFRSTVKPIDPASLVNPIDEEPEAAIVPTYSMKQRSNSSFYDIYSSQGKKLNDKDLTQEEAQTLLEKMSAGTVEG